MALWKKDKDDEFFGDLSEESEKLVNPKEERERDSLLAAESAAAQERFRIIGYHEAYDKTKDEKLQEGFEAGYRESFDTAYRIGEMLGSATATTAHRNPKSTLDSSCIETARLVREALMNVDRDTNLEELEKSVTHKLRRND